ncbi:MAG: hypothetical protein U0X91_00425 [Spirosomataceae bacterium]
MKYLLSSILLVCLVNCEGCITKIPPFNVNGRYKLHRIETSKLNITEFKQEEVLVIPPHNSLNNSLTYTNTVEIYRDRKLVKSIDYTEIETDRKRTFQIYTFADGTKRKFDIVSGNLITSDFVKEIGGKEDTTLLYYKYISYPDLW